MFRSFTIYCYSVIFVTSLVALFIVNVDYDETTTICICYISIFMMILYCINKMLRKDNNWLDPNLFFILGYFIVFMQVPLKIVNGYQVTEIKFGTNFMNYEYVTYGALLALLGLSSYLLGTELYGIIFRNGSKVIFKRSFNKGMIREILNVFFILSVFSFSTFIILIRGKEYGESIGFSAELFYSLTNMFSIMLFATSGYLACLNNVSSFKEYVMSQRRVVLLYFLILSLCFINMGTRAAFITWIIAFLTPYFCFVRKLSLKSFLLAIALGMLLVAWSAAFRSSDDIPIAEKLENSMHVIENMHRLSNDFSNSMYFALTYELEKSYLAYNELLRITDVQGLEYGKGWILQFTSAIFPLSGNVLTIFTDVKKEELASSVALSQLVSKDYYGSGMGSSVIGDIYFNFGRLGVAICMFLLGCLVSFIKSRVFTDINPLSRLMFVSIYSYLLFNGFLICRNEFYLGWTIYIRIFIVFYVTYCVFSKLIKDAN